VQVARTPARWISFFFFYRAQPVRSQFFFFYRAQPALWKSCFTSAAQQLRGAGFQFVRRAEPAARQSTSPVGTVQTLRGGRMLEFCRADPVMKFVF
jgi:hypothetical protein